MQERFTSLKVMVADDEEFVRAIMRRILGSFGIHMIDEASDGAEALAKFELSCPDLLFLDLVMEPMNGIELLRRMREHNIQAVRDLPVIVLTLNSEADMINKVVPFGIEAYLVKPVTPETLRMKIEQALNSKGAVT